MAAKTQSIINFFNTYLSNPQNYVERLKCFIFAKLAIGTSGKSTTSISLSCLNIDRLCEQYSLGSKPNYLLENAFSDFCKELIACNFHENYQRFLSIFTPYIVAQWGEYLKALPSNETIDILTVLYNILSNTRKESCTLKNITNAEISRIFESNSDFYQRLGIGIDQFIDCWNAVYYFSMPALNIPISKNLVEALRFYRRHKVPGISLIKNYNFFQKGTNQPPKNFNPWEDFAQTIGSKNTLSAINTAETITKVTKKIAKEKASDVIRGALYPFSDLSKKKRISGFTSQNDGQFECSFLLREFLSIATSCKSILVVNPSPDFVVALSKNLPHNACQYTIAVSNYYVAMAYRTEFNKMRFCIFDDIDQWQESFDLVALISPNTQEPLDMQGLFSACKQRGKIFALVPQTQNSILGNSIDALYASSCSISKIIAIDSQATFSSPRKKMLIFAQKTDKVNEAVPVFFTQCNNLSQNLIVEKLFIRATLTQLRNNSTLNQIRNQQKPKNPSAVKRNPASIYDFSAEIKLNYTMHQDKAGTFVGESYYRAIPRPKGAFKDPSWNSDATQKGLRGTDPKLIIASIEQVAYYDSIASCIIADIMDFYNGNLDQCSLKTVWFCLRSRLMLQSSYDDSVARNVLFRSGSTLSPICLATANENRFRETMSETIPADSRAIVKYWSQLNIIVRTAVEQGFAQFNPIPSLLSEVSNRASKNLQNTRNMLTKKTFSLEEEIKILSYISEKISVGSKHKKVMRYEAESIWLLGAICLFTGMSFREACALTWADFKMTPNLGVFQFLIYKQIAEDGSVSYLQNSKTGVYCFRRIPVVPLLVQMLLNRRSYMQSTLGFTESQLTSLPIIMPHEYKGAEKCKIAQFCQHTAAAKICRQLSEKAGIPSNEITLPGTEKEIVLDLNKFQGDIFYSNFKHRAIHLGAFTLGELSYILGNKAPTTFSWHYCDYTNELVQYIMVQKLQRWTFSYFYSMDTSTVVTETTEFTGTDQINVGRHQNAIELTLTLECNTANSIISINIDSDHGLTGSCIFFNDQNQEENAL